MPAAATLRLPLMPLRHDDDACCRDDIYADCHDAATRLPPSSFSLLRHALFIYLYTHADVFAAMRADALLLLFDTFICY